MPDFTPRLVLVTVSSLEEARRIARAVLEPHLAACVNIVPGVESHYWWQGKLEEGNEVLLLMKTSAEQFEVVAEVVRTNHSYECPEIVAIAPEEIAPAYRSWWEKECRGSRTSRPWSSVARWSTATGFRRSLNAS